MNMKNRVKIAASSIAVCLVAGLLLFNGGAAKADGEAVVDCNFDDGQIATGIYGNDCTLSVVDNMNSNVKDDGSQTGTGTDGKCVKITGRKGYWEKAAFAFKIDKLEVGKHYVISFDVYHENGEATVSGKEFNSNRALIIHYTDWQQIGQPNTAPSGSWERVSWDFTLPADYKPAGQIIYLELAYPEATDSNENNSYKIENKEEYYIDNFSIKDYVAPTATEVPTEDITTDPTQQVTISENGEEVITETHTEIVNEPDPVIIDEPSLEEGYEEVVKGITYRVTSNNTVAVIGFDIPKSKITIPATIRLEEFDYKVTEIKDKAFKGETDVKSLVIGDNVETIGKNAFYGCKKLKKITIKSTVISKIGSGAFKKAFAKAAVKVPKQNKTAYKKLLKKAGLKSAKIK